MRSINFTLNQLDAFRAVARYNNFSLAASSLCISQPSLTSAIRNLETCLGVRLFSRTTRHVELTSAGMEFLPVVERSFLDLGMARDNLANLGAGRRGTVVIGALPSASADLVPSAIYLFSQQYSDIAVTLKDGVAGRLTEMVRLGEVDFAVGSYTKLEPELRFAPIISDDMHLVCRDDHRLAQCTEVHWSDIVSEPFIAMSQGTSVRHATDQAFARLKVVKYASYEASLLSTMFGLAKAGVGVTALPTTVLDVFNVDRVATIPLVGPVIRRDIGFVTHGGRTPSPAAEKLMAVIAQAFLSSGRRASVRAA